MLTVEGGYAYSEKLPSFSHSEPSPTFRFSDRGAKRLFVCEAQAASFTLLKHH